jgi:hypothetical protein
MSLALQFIGILGLVPQLWFHPQLLFWIGIVFVGASHLNRLFLKAVVDWNGSIREHFVRVD